MKEFPGYTIQGEVRTFKDGNGPKLSNGNLNQKILHHILHAKVKRKAVTHVVMDSFNYMSEGLCSRARKSKQSVKK